MVGQITDIAQVFLLVSETNYLMSVAFSYLFVNAFYQNMFDKNFEIQMSGLTLHNLVHFNGRAVLNSWDVF